MVVLVEDITSSFELEKKKNPMHDNSGSLNLEEIQERALSRQNSSILVGNINNEQLQSEIVINSINKTIRCTGYTFLFCLVIVIITIVIIIAFNK